MSDFRFLHKDSAHGYTDRPLMAMPNEPEAITAMQQAAITERSRQVFEVARADEVARAETRSRCNRLRTLEIEARRKSVDPTRALAQIERGMMMLEQMVRGTIFRGTA